MSCRKVSMLAVAAVGALALTAVSVPAAYATEEHVTNESSVVAGGDPGWTCPPEEEFRITPKVITLTPGQKYQMSWYFWWDPHHDMWYAVDTLDQKVATATDEGLLTAVGEGDTQVVVWVPYHFFQCARARVQVRSVSEDAGIALAQPLFQVKPGSELTVGAFLTPSLQGQQVTWSLEPSSLGAMTTIEGTLPAVKLAASDVEGTGTLTASVTTPSGEVKTTSAQVEVTRNAPSDELRPEARVGKWLQDAHGWWYRNPDGTFPANTAVVIDGATYRFDEQGYMRTGWVPEGDTWFYHDASGAQVSGWVQDGGSWYYLMPGSGAMAIGWVKDGESWYFMRPSGMMMTGWVNDGSAWYYLSPGSGAMVKGRVQVGSSWYYMNPDTGAMMVGWVKDGSAWYYLRPGSGAMATGWLMDGGSWYYLSTDSGAMYTGGHWIGWTWYNFADSGRLMS